MNIITRMLSESLRKRNSQLDLSGSDKRVLSIAYQDLMNNLRVHWGLMTREESESELRAKIHSYFYEKSSELEEFVHLWTGIWLNKWNERVKLILKSETPQHCKRAVKLLRKAESVWRGLEQRKKIKDLVVEALIRNGEICGTSILASDLLKIEIGSFIERKTYTEEIGCLLNIVNTVLKKTRALSRSKGPLIFIRINTKFLKEDLR